MEARGRLRSLHFTRSSDFVHDPVAPGFICPPVFVAVNFNLRFLACEFMPMNVHSGDFIRRRFPIFR